MDCGGAKGAAKGSTAGVDIGAVGDKMIHDRAMAVGGGSLQRAATMLRARGINISAVAQQQQDNLYVIAV
jgi:hypothetical protein